MICRTLLAAVARAVAVIEARRGPFERSVRKIHQLRLFDN